MKILIASSEMVPFSKTGGLADVIGALPKALREIGHDVRVIIPKYKATDTEKFSFKPVLTDLEVMIGDEKELATIYETLIPGTDVTVYLVSNARFFDREGLYQLEGKDHPDNCERFTFFSKAALLFLKRLGWQPHLIHANDWQTALIPCYLKTIYAEDDFLKNIATLYSVHNMGYQGLFPKEKMKVIGLDESYFTYDKLEFYDSLSLAKAGFVYADLIGTVSEGYSREIQTETYGHGLDGLLRYRQKDLFGILNGLDYDLWNPEKDTLIPKRYSSFSLWRKGSNKKNLQKEMGISVKKVPLIGMVQRLADQKGMDILAESLDEILTLDLQLVMLGTGDLKYHQVLADYQKKYPEKLGLKLGFDNHLAHLIYAGSDFFFMPSLYEPCGLGQLISFRYATVPIVRYTGGLADTVTEFKKDTLEGDGFLFYEYSATELKAAVKRAVGIYQNETKAFHKLKKKIIKYDFSWDKSAGKYLKLYERAVEKIA